MTPAQIIALDPNALMASIEGRIAELSDLLHALTTERAILKGELRLLRAGQKSILQVKATLTARHISM